MATGLDAQQQIFAGNPDDRRAFAALEEHYFLEGDWEALAALYRARLEAPSILEHAEQRAALLLRLGQILEERLLDLDGATETYWDLARLDPTHRPGLRQLRGIHARREQWDIVLQIAELESATRMPPYERAEFETDLGRIWQHHLDATDEARAAYERALEVDPDFPPALEGLAQLHSEARRFDQAAKILERLTARVRGPERAPVWIALGRLQAGPLAAPTQARESFAAALEDDPFQAPAVEWALLLATADEDWPVVSELLESRFDLAAGARARAAIAVEASQLQLHHLGAPASARAWVDRGLELAPEEPAVLLAASDVERADGDQEALLRLLDQLISVSGRHAPRAALIEAAELHAELGQPDRALEAAERAAERSGHRDARVLRLQARLLREAGSKRDLAEVLETLTALEGSANAATRACWLRELAALQEDDLGDEESAEQSWRRAFDLEPGSGAAFDALDRRYRKRDDWGSLREVLEAALDATPEATSAPLAARLGTLLLDHFDDPVRARSLLERALAADDGCRPALTGLRRIAEAEDDPDLLLDLCAREALDCRDARAMAECVATVRPILEARRDRETLLEWASRWADLDPESVGALTLLADLEAGLERHEDELETRHRLARLQHGAERSDTLQREAALHRRLGRHAQAAAALERALEATPDSTLVIEALCEVYRLLEQPQALARNLRLLADRLPPEEQAEPLEELAVTLHDVLGDVDTAIVVRWRLVELPDPPAEAPGRLEALLDQAGRHTELVQLLEEQRRRVGDETPEAFELDLRRATLLLDSLGRCDDAAALYAALHERHPENDEILDRLERALRGGDDAAALCALLARRADWTEEPERRAEILLEHAILTEEALGDPTAACALYESVLDQHPEAPASDRADRRLAALLESTEQWSRLRDRLEVRAQSLTGRAAASLHEEIATLCRDRLQDMAGCADQLERVARLDPARVHVWQQLEEIYTRELDRPGDWLRVVERELATSPAPEREIGLRVNAARLCLDVERRPDGHDDAEAYLHYARVLELAPSHAEAAEVLAVHYGATERPAEAAAVIEGRLAVLGNERSGQAADLRLRLARLYAGPLEQDTKARPLFEEALAALGPLPRVADPLAALYERAADPAALASLAGAVLDRTAETAESLPWRVRLGRSEEALGRLDEAAVAYRAVLDATPDDREIEDALIGVYARLDEVDPLTELLERRLDFALEDEQIDLRLRLARLHADRRGDPDEGLRHLEWVLERHPQHRDAFEQARTIATRLGDAERHLALLDRMLSTPLPDAERASLLEERGRLLVDDLDAPEQAVLAFREALSFDPDSESVRSALREQLERLERWPALLDRLFVEAMDAPPEHRFALLDEAARLAWQRLGPDASLPWLARLQRERPEDPELFARLAEVHRRAGRFEAALRALDEEIQRSPRAERAELHLQRARLLERELHAPSRAIQAYREALDLAEDPGEILGELDRLFDLMGRPAERAEILEARLEAMADADRFALRRELASLYCVDLGRPDRAIPHLTANADACAGSGGDELAALGALEAALRASGRQAEWLGVAERQLALIEADPERASSTPTGFRRYLLEELARTWDAVMGHADRALIHARALCEDVADTTTPQAAHLRDLLRRTGRRAELARALTQHAEAGCASGEEWLELARLREEVLLDLEGARSAYVEAGSEPALRLDAARGRRRTSERLRDWAAMAAALEDEYALEDRLTPRERAAIARRLGDLYRTRLGSGERAAAAYRLALDLDERDLEALRALIAVEETLGAPERVVDLCRAELALLGDDEAHRTRCVELWLRIASLCAEACDRPHDAIEALREAAALSRLPAPDQLRLARLYAQVAEREDDTAARDAWFESFGSWCDREDAATTLEDHLSLAEALRAADRIDDAANRAERATTVAPESHAAWALRGALARDAGDADAAADALERAARHAPARPAAGYALAAADCIETANPERALGLLRRALDRDPGRLDALVAATRVASRLECHPDARHFAERAIELARSERLDDDAFRETALLGGRAARTLDDRKMARALFAAALEVAADEIEALEGVAEADFDDGELSSARHLLERRLELGGEHPQRAQHLAMIARGLEAEAHLDAAWSRYEEAIEVDPELDDAHDGLVRVHERAGRTAEALAALTRWSEAAPEAETRARTALRAAEHAMALERPDTAIAQLELATAADPGLAPAWLMLCELAAEREPDGFLRGLCDRALAAIEPGPLSAPISMRAARLAEVAGDPEAARTRYAEAARWDPRNTEAALCQSRLVRGAGDWAGANEVLERFLEVHPDPESPTLAHVHLERGRLLAGPLESCDGAIAAYEEALRLQPDLAVARTALGRLLMHVPGRWREALALHREILAASPTTAGSLRAIAQLADQRRAHDVTEAARVVLRALGLAPPAEEEGAATLPLTLLPGPPMADPEHERLRRLVHQMREELGPVVQDALPERTPCTDDAVEHAIRSLQAIEDEISAPGLARLDPDERRDLFRAMVDLLLERSGSADSPGESRFRAVLDAALGRRSRRKARRFLEETSAEAIASVDPLVWGEALRALAAALAVDRSGGDLAGVLRALLTLEADAGHDPSLDGAELATLAGSSETARRLLTCVADRLCKRLEQSR